MVLARTRPEHALLALDPLPGDAGVVRDAPTGGDAELLEDRVRPGEREPALASDRAREILDDPPILARLAGTGDRLVDLDHAPFGVRHRALVFLVQRAGEDEI